MINRDVPLKVQFFPPKNLSEVFYYLRIATGILVGQAKTSQVF